MNVSALCSQSLSSLLIMGIYMCSGVDRMRSSVYICFRQEHIIELFPNYVSGSADILGDINVFCEVVWGSIFGIIPTMSNSYRYTKAN